MFAAHMFTLTVLFVTSAVYAFFHLTTPYENLQEVCSSIGSRDEFYMFLCDGELFGEIIAVFRYRSISV